MKRFWLAGIVAAILFGLPVQAGLLPSREGMTEVAPGLWIDRAAKPAAIARIRRDIAAAEKVVGKALGGVARPEWLVCTTRACDRRNNYTTRGMTYGYSLIIVNSKGAKSAGVFSHELTHATLHSAIPPLGLLTGALPIWFDEGAAVLISGEPAQAADAAACAGRQVPLPRNHREFSRRSGVKGEGALALYVASTCAVRGWLAQGNTLRDMLPQMQQKGRLP